MEEILSSEASPPAKSTCSVRLVQFRFNLPSVDRDTSVGIATRYGLDGPGMESRRGGEIFRNRPDWPWRPPSFLYNGYRVFPGVKATGA
jgi:hypothetical protein